MGKRKSKPQTSTPWSLPELLKADRNAITVYVALRYLSGTKRQITTTRAGITAVCGLHKQTITKAMNVLGKANWVKVRYRHEPGRQWYALSFPKRFFYEDDFFGLIGSHPRRKNRPHRERSMRTKKTTSPPSGDRGGQTVPAPSPTGERGRTTPDTTQTTTGNPTTEMCEPTPIVLDVAIPDDAPDWVRGADEGKEASKS